MLCTEADRVGLQRQHRPLRVEQLVFVERACMDAGNENLPHAGRADPAHLVAAAVPEIEIAHDRDAARIGRPDREMDAFDVLMGDHMGAELLPEPRMRPLPDQIFVDRAQHRREAVRVVEIPCRLIVPRAQTVGFLGPFAGEDPRHDGLQRDLCLAKRPDLFRAGHQRHDFPVMQPQHGKRIGMLRVDKRFGLVAGNCHSAPWFTGPIAWSRSRPCSP